MVRLGSLTTIDFGIRRRRRAPFWISNCCLLASYSSCRGCFLPQINANNIWGRESQASTRLFSSSRNIGNRQVCVVQDEQDYNTYRHTVAQHIAESLSLPLMTTPEFLAQQTEAGFTHMLCLEDYPESILDETDQYALAIKPTTMGETKRSRRKSKTKPALPKIKPFLIDLSPPTPTTRSGPDLLLQAVAPQRVEGGAVVYDLTAGWAQDSLLMAHGGASRVCMVERDPIVACLLQDALRRLNCIARSTSTSSWQQRAKDLDGTLSLQVDDARDVLSKPTSQPDIVYLDPMFPPRTKTAAVKKGMQILHGLFETSQVADDESTAIRATEEAELLNLAFQSALVKVVVKRPINAPLLGLDETDLKPSNTVKGSINRWDVYVKG